MRKIVPREELAKWINVDKIDDLNQELTIDLLRRLGIALMPIVYQEAPRRMADQLEEQCNDPQDVKIEDIKELTDGFFTDLLFYCFNEIINKINYFGESGVNFSQNMSDDKFKQRYGYDYKRKK